MNKGFITVLALATIFFTSVISAAQTEQLLDPVTVTSSLIEKRGSETGRNITIIKGESFSKLPVHSLDELLKFLPGIEVQSRGPQGSQSDISMRGGTFQQVLVILDGLRLNDPNTGHFNAYIPIATAEIDRIEILKGASSAIYGSDAVGGVINIITKAFSASQQAENKKLKAQVAVGEYGLCNANIGGFLKSKNISAGAGVITNNATGVMQRGTRGFFHNTSASAGIHFKLNEQWSLSFRSAYDSRNFAAQNFYTSFVSDTAKEKISSWWHQAKIAFEKNRSKFNADAGYKELQDEFAYNSASTPNRSKSKLFQTLFSFQQIISNGTSLVAGFNFQQKSITSNDRGNHSINVAAPFINVIQKIGAAITVQPSLRVEFIGKNAAEFLPQLNLSAKVNNVQLRASGGKTIRDADFTERYNNYNKPSVKSGSIGFPGLTAEQSWNYEAGFDWFAINGMKISGTFFQRFHTKLIDWINTPYTDMPRKDNLVAGGTYALAKNIAKVNTTGAEMDIQYIRQFGEKQNVLFNTGLLWLNSKSTEPNLSFYINSHAKFITNFTTAYSYGPFAISFSGIYKSRKPQAAPAINAYVSTNYFLLNGKASYNFIKNKSGAFIQVDNIFDRTYSDLLGSMMPGRWISIGINFNL